MFLATGDAKYIDVLELALYNSVLAGVSLSGTDYFYVNPLRQVDALPTRLRWSRTRVPFVTSYCCPPNVFRTLAEANGYAYAKTDDAVFVNLFGGSDLATTLGDAPLKLRQITAYPWGGDVVIHIDDCPSREFAVKVRIPSWATSAEVLVNRRPVEIATTPGTYAEVRRTWKRGDEIELRLPLEPVLLESHPLVEETRNQVAVKRGPIVYCLESPDLPEGVRVEVVAIPAAARFRPTNLGALLGGVTVLEGELVARRSPPWDGALYRPRTPPAERKAPMRLIPYYAWSNRGPSEMSVWLPLE
jgi:DUF1680 family protein